MPVAGKSRISASGVGRNGWCRPNWQQGNGHSTPQPISPQVPAFRVQRFIPAFRRCLAICSQSSAFIDLLGAKSDDDAFGTELVESSRYADTVLTGTSLRRVVEY